MSCIKLQVVFDCNFIYIWKLQLLPNVSSNILVYTGSKPKFYSFHCIDNISILIYSFTHIFMYFHFTMFPLILHFYKVLYISVKQEISFSKVYR